MEPTVTTARAAEIISIGYEGLRSYLKRGLLGASGILVPFVHRDFPAPDLSSVRAKWKRFGFVDLCLMRLAKQLIDLGLSFDQANSIVSREDIRDVFEREHIAGSVLLASPPYYDFIVFSGDNLNHLPARLAEVGNVAVLVQLDRIRDYVRAEFERDRTSQRSVEV